MLFIEYLSFLCIYIGNGRLICKINVCLCEYLKYLFVFIYRDLLSNKLIVLGENIFGGLRSLVKYL